LGERFSPLVTFFSLVSSRAFRDAPYSRFRCGDPNQCLHNFVKMLLLALPQIYTCISLVQVYLFGECLGERFSPLSTFFPLVSSRAFRDAPDSRFRCGDPNQCLPNFLKSATFCLPLNVHTCILLVEKYRCAQYLGWRCLPISTFFSVLSSIDLGSA